MESSGPGLGPLPGNNYTLKREKVIKPLNNSGPADDPNVAVEMIRKKLQQLYAKEPDAKLEQKEVENLEKRSVHQEFMHQLSHSGLSLAEIQTKWHEYYVGLPDAEKHKVWQEFYATYNQHHTPKTEPKHEPKPKAHHAAVVSHVAQPEASDSRTVEQVKEQIIKKVRTRPKAKSSHLQSVMFGLGAGFVMLAVLLFGFFNERFIAPFITPSKSISSTPLIIDPASTAVGKDPKIIIPKINVEIPVVYDEPSIEEAAVQVALERGVVHYPTTALPGQGGNGVIFGHSANNILNKGKYKFAFVLLRKLEIGDTFYIEKDSKRYVYKIFDKKVVPPTEVSVLKAGEKPATFTLITCDPPGTNINRLVVVGEQISPDPTGVQPAPTQVTTTAKPAQLPGNSPSLWSRIWNW